GSRQWDCYDLIEWIAAQVWCDGNVGMVGITGFGAEQLAVAKQAPPHLKAIFPFDSRGAMASLAVSATNIPAASFIFSPTWWGIFRPSTKARTPPPHCRRSASVCGRKR